MTAKTPQFPIVDAILLTPPEGKDGFIGICTNTTAPGQVLNELEGKERRFVSVLGSLIVSRDGAERMILNSLSHPTLAYLILFSEESLTFSPSTNLLLALQYGVNTEDRDHPIVNGRAASSHYPNLSGEIVDSFRENITVLPMFMYRNDYGKKIIMDYLLWARPRLPDEVYEFLKEVNEKGKIYYDSLNKLVSLLGASEPAKRGVVELDPKEFQHLQPPKVAIPAKEIIPEVTFRVQNEKGVLRLDIKLGEETFFIKSTDDFLLEYSLMKFLGERKKEISQLDQLYLGAELARVSSEIKNEIKFPSFVKSGNIAGEKEIMLESKISLITDKKYYYKINVKAGQVAVMCLAFDVCEQVFELRSPKIGGLFEWIAEKNRFENYEMDILHRLDIGGQIGRAAIAASLDYAFIQDFANIFKINTENLPLLIADGDNFLDVHKQVLMKIYTQGLTEEHGDKQKGLARSAVMLAIYRNTEKSLSSLPALYKQGERSTEEIRSAYKAQLLRFDHDGDYSYGERTRVFFGFDQLPKTALVLRENPNRAAIIQRFDPVEDMKSYVDPDTGKTKYTHDPCLTHDIFFLEDGRLHSFHIARAHNTVNAYPENVFGLYDAYVSTVRDELHAKPGDMYMLSSRANILLLTEEQRTKKLMGEPSKPADEIDSKSGPHQLAENAKVPKANETGVAYCFLPLQKITSRPNNPILGRLENMEGVNTIEKAVSYLKEKGVMHNNPILTEYKAGKMDPQGDYLAYFQANVMGDKVHATAVFMNHSIGKQKEDINLLNYIATKYSETLGYPLGNLSLFYVAFTK
ncbi:MAG: hypothetical protein WC835_00650 [Candidatus Paceibacterota bacterium]|jgi:thymidylate synthase